MTRPTKEHVFMTIAHELATLATCAKKHVGCVLLDKHNRVLATGYNGAPRGHTHCDREDPCPAFKDDSISCNAIHAEMNALMQCSNIDAIYTAYVTEAPCFKCRLLLENTGCKKIVYIQNGVMREEQL